MQLIDPLRPADVFVVQFDPRPDVVDIVDGKLKLYVCAAVSATKRNGDGRSSAAIVVTDDNVAPLQKRKQLKTKWRRQLIIVTFVRCPFHDKYY